MDLINRYAHEVGQYLPHRLRADVEAELRSLLADSVEEKALLGGVPAGEELAAQVLREFGAPKDVAGRYAPEPQYLIGPRLYPTYLMAVKVMLPILAAIVLALVVAGRFQEPGEPPSLAVFVRATGRFLWGALENLGIMTLVFALVERTDPGAGGGLEAWILRASARERSIDLLLPAESFALYAIAVLVLRSTSSQLGGGVRVPRQRGAPVPLLTQDFNRYLPLLSTRGGSWRSSSTWWSCAGRWTRPTLGSSSLQGWQRHHSRAIVTGRRCSVTRSSRSCCSGSSSSASTRACCCPAAFHAGRTVGAGVTAGLDFGAGGLRL
jgi:hypothetical protein